MNKKNIFSTNEIEVIELQTQNNLTVVQIKDTSIHPLGLISIHEAFKNNEVEITEINNDGQVNKVILKNLSSKNILILDGDILEGAKQNRVINTSILVGAKQTVEIPVSCVERGRWNYSSDKFTQSDTIASKNIRFQKAEDIFKHRKHNEESVFMACQSRVWEKVNEDLMCFNLESSTESHSELFDKKRDEFDSVTNNIKLNTEANGLAYFINGKLYGMELFNSKEIYKDYFEKILSSIAMDTRMNEKQGINKDQVAIENVLEKINNSIVLDKNEKDSIEISKGVCLGDEARLVHGNEQSQTAYYNLQYNDQTIHQSILIKKST